MTTDDTTTQTKSEQGVIESISGLLIKASGMGQAKMYEVVFVSGEKLMGEVIELNGDVASIQVYEDTSGLTPGDIVTRTGETMSAELAPGLLESIYDGIQRPLKLIEEKSDSFYIQRGVKADGIDREKKWDFQALAKTGDTVVTGDILGTVEETSLITHKIMVPPECDGIVESVKSGSYTVTDTVAVIKTKDGTTKEIQMLQRWPIRTPRGKKGKLFPNTPLATGIRSVDSLFPIAKGGAGAVPGPFGSGKTVIQQSLAKYCDAQVIVYIGCGERGNEMTEVLNEFPELLDPNTGEPLIKRTVLIANTSNMPVAAREASIYTGVTIAEYYRDMGYSVALMADSTSRWAEAMREISGRLEEMPGEEGYPAYLASKTSAFYERAGYVECLGSDDRTGALTIIGAVSPPGGDLSEPVSQATLRVTKTFWGLDAALAYKKHFPTINWLNSYSLYVDNFRAFWKENVGEDFEQIREDVMTLLSEEDRLNEIVRLVGMEALADGEKIILEIARSIREDFLFQNAFDEYDAYTPLQKQYEILKSIVSVYQNAKDASSAEEFEFESFAQLPVVKELANLKNYDVDKPELFEQFREQAEREIQNLISVPANITA
ncbi:MAG: V-type ATP synthase subunit A [Candidatus Paceibacterota bacterium]